MKRPTQPALTAQALLAHLAAARIGYEPPSSGGCKHADGALPASLFLHRHWEVPEHSVAARALLAASTRRTLAAPGRASADPEPAAIESTVDHLRGRTLAQANQAEARHAQPASAGTMSALDMNDESVEVEGTVAGVAVAERREWCGNSMEADVATGTGAGDKLGKSTPQQADLTAQEPDSPVHRSYEVPLRHGRASSESPAVLDLQSTSCAQLFALTHRSGAAQACGGSLLTCAQPDRHHVSCISAVQLDACCQIALLWLIVSQHCEMSVHA